MTAGLELNLAGIELEHPLMNAAGTIKTLEDVKRIAPSATSAVMIGSITFSARGGNSGNVYWSSPEFSLNSLGLPNPGADYYKANLREMTSIAHSHGKPLFVSIAGFTRMEYAILAEIAFANGASMVELNLGCPNVWDDGTQKGIPSFYPDEIEELLASLEHCIRGAGPIAVKLSPISNPYQLREVALALSKNHVVKVVTASNCFPNATAFDNAGNTVLDPGDGLAGLGGPSMLPIGLGQVKQFRNILPEHIQMIGVGGISSWRNIVDYRHAGADAAQVNTAYSDQGKGVFGRIIQEYVDLLG